MAHEDNTIGCGNSGGGRSKKTVKQKKVPQRGLGVAQLEKIRIEEQQKKETLQILVKNGVSASPTDHTSPFFMSVLSPFPLSPVTNNNSLPSPNAAFYRHAASAPNLELVHHRENSSSVQISKQLINSGEKQSFDHRGFAFDQQVIKNLPFGPQRSHQFHLPHSSSSSMFEVNNSSGMILPSSVASSQTEPPSNQIFRGSNYTPNLWREEDKRVGMKRPNPFSLESPHAPFVHSNYHPTLAASISKSDESPSCIKYTALMEPRNKCTREGISNSSPLPELNPTEVKRDSGKLNGDFLTLAPPSVASPPLKLSEYEHMPNQENSTSQIHRPGKSGSVEGSFSFFPVKMPTNQTTANGDTVETIDLSLKL